MREKPIIDRQRERRETEWSQHVHDVAEDLVSLLGPGEVLERVERSGDRITIRVSRDRAGTPRRGETRQKEERTSSIYTAWFERGVI